MQPAHPIVIRPATIEDADALRDLRIEALSGHPTAFTADLDQTLAKPRRAWQERAARSGGEGSEVIMIAQEGGELAGMAGVYTPKEPKLAHAGIVWGVYVRDGFRGRGIGERLVRGCIAWARTKGLVSLKLSTRLGNESALRCYRRCGFVQYGVEPMFLCWEGRRYDEVLLAVRLGGGE